MRLRDRVAIVTGGGQGIGRAYALRFAQEGAHVVVADKNEENAQNVYQELKDKGCKSMAVQVDVRQQESVNTMVSQVVEMFGCIDILINNAAYFSTIEMKPIDQLSLEEWNLALEVNLTGVFLCSKAVIPPMREKKYGRILNISSGTVLWGRPNYIHYVTSKMGVVGFTRALARELGGDNITVNTLAPGPVRTEVQRGTVSEEQFSALMAQQCIKRLGTPEDIVGSAVFLCSDDASFLTGQFLLVDGGKGMH